MWDTEDVDLGVDRMEVQISTNDGSSWDTLRSWDAGDVEPAGWMSESISLDDYTANYVLVRFLFDTVDDISNDHPGWFIDNVQVDIQKSSADFDEVQRWYDNNPNYMEVPRQGVSNGGLDQMGIFHHLVLVPYLDRGSCGVAEPSTNDLAVVADQKFKDGDCDANSGPAFTDTILEELGHLDFDEIEPSDDQCDSSTWPDQFETHDKFDNYAIECGVNADIDDLKSPNRWDEYLSVIDTSDDDEIGSDNPGDLNNGLQAGEVD